MIRSMLRDLKESILILSLVNIFYIQYSFIYFVSIGIFIKQIQKIGVKNPVIIIDEIDKIGHDRVKG
jgi:hypothetical protein